MTVACGYLNDDGTRCNDPAITFCQLTEIVSVPACEAHSSGVCLIVPEVAEDIT